MVEVATDAIAFVVLEMGLTAIEGPLVMPAIIDLHLEPEIGPKEAFTVQQNLSGDDIDLFLAGAAEDIERKRTQAISRVDMEDVVPRTGTQAFVHRMINAGVRLANPEIDLVSEALEQLHGAVIGTSVDDYDFDLGGLVRKDAVDDLTELVAVAKHDDDY